MKSSHEGASGSGAGHVKKMMSAHGCPDHRRVHGKSSGTGGNQGKASASKSDERHMERDEREGG